MAFTEFHYRMGLDSVDWTQFFRLELRFWISFVAVFVTVKLCIIRIVG